MLRLAFESNCTHIAFADGDNAWLPEVVVAMLRSGKNFVQAPYMRRDGRGYSVRPIEEVRRLGNYLPEHIQDDETVEIEGTGFGLTILSRACMEQMLAAYGGKDLDFFDRIGDQVYLTTALFQLMIRDRVLLGEDMSFAQRWRDLGNKIWMYIGQGSPIAHYGHALYQGKIDDLGFEHNERAA